MVNARRSDIIGIPERELTPITEAHPPKQPPKWDSETLVLENQRLVKELEIVRRELETYSKQLGQRAIVADKKLERNHQQLKSTFEELKRTYKTLQAERESIFRTNEDLADKVCTQLACDEGYADHTAGHAEPLNAVRKPIATGQQLEMHDCKFGPRGVLQLPRYVSRIMGNTLVLNPMNHTTHVIGHRIPGVGWSQQRNQAHGRDDEPSTGRQRCQLGRRRPRAVPLRDHSLSPNHPIIDCRRSKTRRCPHD